MTSRPPYNSKAGLAALRYGRHAIRNPKEDTMPTEHHTHYARGHAIEVWLTPDELRARGTNKASQLALHGPDAVSHDGERTRWTPPEVLVIPRAQIARVEHHRPALAGLVNGRLVITTTAGKRYELHYRKKSGAAFDELAADLEAAG